MLKFGKPKPTKMTKEEYLAIAAAKYDELQALNKIDNFYDYEKTFEKIWIDTGRAVLEKNISDLPADWRKKKHLRNLGTSK
jgi:mannitol/fructose-specific phosphotransferase system IIA component